ncbi:MAG: TolC family protein [Bacteroidales bacterium]|nr:TolC family protein [Bacteroidales bacterium]
MKGKLKFLSLMLLGVLATHNVHAQETDKNKGIIAGYFDTDTENGGENIDYSSFKLPPLGLLFENAKSNPSIEQLAREEAFQRELLKKEKKSWSEWLAGYASYSYGVMDNYGSSENVATPIYYQYVGSKQHYWNIGARANVPLDNVLDLKGRVKRQRLQTEKAQLAKDIAYEQLKQTIATLYVRITNNLISLKTASENAAAYKGAGLLTKEEFKMGDATVRDLAETKRWESNVTQAYQDLQSTITTDILVLEIITHTPIITNAIVEITYTDKK